MVHARLVTPLSSLTAKQGDPVEALITAPLVVLGPPDSAGGKCDQRVGSTGATCAADGTQRAVAHPVSSAAPPNGLEQKVETNLEAVAVAKDEHLKLDAEGGAQVTTPRTRYLTTGIQLMLAATQAAPDRDAGQGI